MGDYNLNLLSALSSPSNPSASIDEVLDEVITVQAKLTTLSMPDLSGSKEKKTGNYANNYDHFTYSLKSSPFQSVTYDRVDAIEKYCGGDDNGTVYWLNISSKWIWKDGIDAEAVLPDDIISWLTANKDSIDMNITEYYESQEGSL